MLSRRLLQGIPIVLGILVVNFLLLNATPGDVVDAMVGQMGASDPELVARMKERFGLDQPLLVRLGLYMWNLARLDLGFSAFYNMPVETLILERLAGTALLMLSSIGVALVLGVVSGVAAARRFNTAWDMLIGVAALLFYATPVFWIGLMMLVLFSVHLGILPLGGMSTIAADFGPVEATLDVLWHLILPMTTLSLFFIATYTRLMRSSMLEAYQQDYVRTARAKGVPEGRVAYRHVLRNALLPVVTVVGVQIGALLGGAVVVETVFNWPGLGRLAYDAVLQRDFNLLLGILFVSSVVVVVVNILVDLLYAALDPRIEVG
ncbi:ABC transporter permease [Falsiroseomonas oryzae]|uniref:ABC transporter permease n=1 Tax=Falsiroseomonas oryzae TaxID=2766473 RepID=UPI0022EA2754|nr:ABC transporter permease [Roseomonas sp. MO-31]